MFGSRFEIADQVLADLELKPSFLQQLLSFERPLGSFESCGGVAADTSEAIGQPIQTILQSMAQLLLLVSGGIVCFRKLACLVRSRCSCWHGQPRFGLERLQFEQLGVRGRHKLKGQVSESRLLEELLLRNTYINSQMGPLAEIQPAPQSSGARVWSCLVNMSSRFDDGQGRKEVMILSPGFSFRRIWS